MSRNALLAVAAGLVILALTLFVSRQLGFVFLFLPLVFFWGRGPRGDG